MSDRLTVPERADRMPSPGATHPHLGRVEVRGICKAYGPLTVLHETNLVIEQGEFFTLLGPSGSGKTTLLNIIAGFTEQSAGTVHIDDVRVDNLPIHKRNIGMVFQNYSLIPHLTVSENVAFPLTMRKVPAAEIIERVQRALVMVQMEAHGKKRPAQLSGGQQQRVAIARALVFEPSVMLMDEPMSALDRKLRGQLQIELRNLQRSLGITMIFVTHDQDEALTMSDRLAVLNEGSVTQVGTPAEIYEEPAGLFQAQFLGDSTTLEGVATEVAGNRATIEFDDGTTVFGRSVQVVAGARVKANIRAERIRLQPITGADAAVRATVTDVIYVGSEVRYVASTGFCPQMLVRSPNTGSAPPFAIGEVVEMTWDAKDLACFGDGSDD